MNYGTDYFYKATAIDQANNESEFSQTVTGTLLIDNTPPHIHSISPINGAMVGLNAKIRVLAQDMGGLVSVTAEYEENEDWKLIGIVPATGDSFIANFIWDNNHLPSGEHNLRFSTIDKAGNESEYFEAVYKIKNNIPDAPILTATPGEWSMSLDFTTVDDSDLLGYKLFRDDKLVTTFGLNAADALPYTETKLRGDRSYNYYVEAHDKYGNISTSEVITATPIDHNPNPPVAVAEFSTHSPIGVEVEFDATNSTDDDEIVSYHWDFGDGNTADTQIATNVFESAANYDISLTVINSFGSEHTSNNTLFAMSGSDLGSIEVNVYDSSDGGNPLADAIVCAVDVKTIDDEEPITFIGKTAGNGKAIITDVPKGTYTVYAYKKDYMPNQSIQNVVVNGGGVRPSREITLDKDPIIVGKITHERLTLKKILDEGIDITIPENQFIYEFTVTFTFMETAMEDSGGGAGGGGGSFGSGGGGVGGIGVGGSGSATFKTNGLGILIEPPTFSNPAIEKHIILDTVPVPTRPDIPPQVVIMQVSSSYLREFFAVNIMMVNQADKQFSLKDNSIELKLPPGLSLAPMDDPPQSLIQETEVIEGGNGTWDVSWIVRGDVEGEYDIKAVYEGLLMPFKETVTATFSTDEKNPVIVKGAKGLTMFLNYFKGAKAGKEYKIGFTLTNMSDISQYANNIEFKNGKTQEEVKGERHEFIRLIDGPDNKTDYVDESIPLPHDLTVRDGDSIYVDILKPGESIKGTYCTVFAEDYSEDELYFILTELFIEGLLVVPGVDPSLGDDDGNGEDDPLIEVIDFDEIEWLLFDDDSVGVYISSEPVTFSNGKEYWLSATHDLNGSDNLAKLEMLDDDWKFIGYVEVEMVMPSNEISSYGMMDLTGFGIAEDIRQIFIKSNKVSRLSIRDFNNMDAPKHQEPKDGTRTDKLMNVLFFSYGLAEYGIEVIEGLTPDPAAIRDIVKNIKEIEEIINALADAAYDIAQIIDELKIEMMNEGKSTREITSEINKMLGEVFAEILGESISIAWDGVSEVIAADFANLVDNFDKERIGKYSNNEAYQLGRSAGAVWENIVNAVAIAYGAGKLGDAVFPGSPNISKGIKQTTTKLKDAIKKWTAKRFIGGSGNLKPQHLMEELAKSGVKYNPDDVIMITKSKDGKLMWLEKGNSSAGLQHIIETHAKDFAGRGIDTNNIPTILKDTLQNVPISTGMTPRGPYSIYLINGKEYLLAYGTNGYIVSFYPH